MAQRASHGTRFRYTSASTHRTSASVATGGHGGHAPRLTASDRAAGIIEQHVPRSRYARVRLEGPDALIGPAIACVRDLWCPARDERPASAPVLLRRVLLRRLRLYPDVAEQDACSDLCFPLSE